MKNFSMMIVAALCVCAMLGAATAAFGGEKEVVVVNTSSNPVPVNIVNTPVPVTMGAKAPYVNSVTCEAATFSTCVADVYTVPAGKRLVVEHFSCSGSLSPGQVLTCRITAGNGVLVPVFLPTTSLAPSGGLGDITQMGTGQLIRLYAAAGEEIRAGAWVGGTVSAYVPTIRFSVVGYLEAAP